MAENTIQTNQEGQVKELSVQEGQVKKPSISERFTNKIISELGGDVSDIMQLSEYQRRLIQGYFIGVDRALKAAEERRISKNEKNSNHKYDETLEYKWDNVNMNSLAMDLVHYARIGLDMMQENHLFAIPYKNKRTQKYDIVLMEGYNGIKYIAEKYAVEKPVSVTAELVYSNDKFRPIKKSRSNKVENYEFDIENPFDRGEIIGGFGYIEYKDETKNKLIIMTIKDILKRKPEKASSEFWGGEKTVWENGKQSKADTEGWFEEMCLKTLKREIYSAKHIPRDPMKIDENYEYLRAREIKNAAAEAQAEIDANANRIIIDAETISEPQLPIKAPEPFEMVDEVTGEIIAPADESAFIFSTPDNAEFISEYTDDDVSLAGGPDF